MKIKTSELIGFALNWAVESIEIARMRAAGEHVKQWWVEQVQVAPSRYSSDWLLGGPIIEREKISVWETMAGVSDMPWSAVTDIGTWAVDGQPERRESFGETPLIVAMRAYIASKLGDEVTIPKELVNDL